MENISFGGVSETVNIAMVNKDYDRYLMELADIIEEEIIVSPGGIELVYAEDIAATSGSNNMDYFNF